MGLGELVVRLHEHQRERATGAVVLSVLAGPALPAFGAWERWAAQAGLLPLVAEAADEPEALAQLLGQVPHLRVLPQARAHLAAAAHLAAHELSAACRARGEDELARWLAELGSDDVTRVAAWLVASSRGAGPAALRAAPLPPRRLVLALAELAAPIALLWMPPDDGSAAWLDGALRTAGGLALAAPGVPIGVIAASAALELVAPALRGSALGSLVRAGTVASGEEAAPAGRARSRSESALFGALAADPRTRGHFTLNERIAVRGATAEVDLWAARARLAVEVDGWYHFRDLDAYRRDRTKDVQLQDAGYFVMRFCAEDVESRLELTVEHIAEVLEHRLATPRPASPRTRR